MADKEEGSEKIKLWRRKYSDDQLSGMATTLMVLDGVPTSQLYGGVIQRTYFDLLVKEGAADSRTGRLTQSGKQKARQVSGFLANLLSFERY